MVKSACYVAYAADPGSSPPGRQTFLYVTPPSLSRNLLFLYFKIMESMPEKILIKNEKLIKNIYLKCCSQMSLSPINTVILSARLQSTCSRKLHFLGFKMIYLEYIWCMVLVILTN